MAAKPIPEGYHSATPYLTVRGAAKAIEFYKKAFGAQELMRMPGPEGRIGHAEIRIGDSVIMLTDEAPENSTSRSPEALGGTTASIFLYVDNVDALVSRAVEAGATVTVPLQDMFWGDRFGQLKDPFGHNWGVATHKEDLTPEEIARRAPRP